MIYPLPEPPAVVELFGDGDDRRLASKFEYTRRSAELLFLFFADLQTRMTVKHRMGIARWALRQKSKYFQLMKEGEEK